MVAILSSKSFFDYLQFLKSNAHHEPNSASTPGILIIHDRSLESFIALKYPVSHNAMHKICCISPCLSVLYNYVFNIMIARALFLAAGSPNWA